nr:MAG TPA: hypothetical protein [Caudoviricetes sp.]
MRYFLLFLCIHKTLLHRHLHYLLKQICCFA